MLKVKRAEVEKPKSYKREFRKRKTNYFVLKLVGVWVLILLGAVGVSTWLAKRKPVQQDVAVVSERASKGTLADEDVALLGKAYPKCRETMGGFLSAGTPEVRNQFVYRAVDTAGRMARFYQLNPISNVDPRTIRGTGAEVMHLPDGKAILTRWETTDGREIDAVFYPEGSEWKLDWENYVRYSDHPWALFMAGQGPDEGEFRVLARERLAEQRSEISQLKIMLHAPRFGHPNEEGEGSPEFLVDQESEAGRLLKEALALRAAGKQIYSSTLPNHDPEGMIRVRVKVRRSQGALGREFTIEKVLACHWLSIPETGVELK